MLVACCMVLLEKLVVAQLAVFRRFTTCSYSEPDESKQLIRDSII
jgi:hypothetical protein